MKVVLGLKINKATGQNGITAKFVKEGGEQIISDVWEKEEISRAVGRSCFMTYSQKGR